MPREKKTGHTIFARRLTEVRKGRQLTQAELAKQMGIARGMIGYYESSAKNPTVDTVQMFADFFEVPMVELLQEEDNAKRSPGPKSRIDELTEKVKGLSQYKQRIVCGVIEATLAAQ